MKTLFTIAFGLIVIFSAGVYADGMGFAVDPTHPKAGEQFTIKVTAGSEERISSIVYNGDSTKKICNDNDGSDAYTCSNIWVFTAIEDRTYSFTMYRYDGITYTDSVHVTLATAETEPALEPTGDTIDPDLDISVSKTNPSVGEAIELTVSAEDNVELDYVRVSWDGNMNIPLSECNNEKECDDIKRTISFSTAGTHQVVVKAKDQSGNSETERLTITVQGTEAPASESPQPSAPSTSTGGGSTYHGPYPSFKVTPDNFVVGEVLTFDASGSRTDGTATIIRYGWDFNGDSRDDLITTSPTVTHAYISEGHYKIRLFVTDSFGMTSYTYRDVVVKACCKIETSGFFNIRIMHDGKPVESATVTLKSNAIYAKSTDKSGFANVSVAPACYTITVDHPKYKFSEKSECIEAGKTKSIEISSEGRTMFSPAVKYLKENWEITIPIAVLLIAAAVALAAYVLNDPWRKEQRFDFESRDFEP